MNAVVTVQRDQVRRALRDVIIHGVVVQAACVTTLLLLGAWLAKGALTGGLWRLSAADCRAVLLVWAALALPVVALALKTAWRHAVFLVAPEGRRARMRATGCR